MLSIINNSIIKYNQKHTRSNRCSLIPRCSHCKQLGHKINECQDSSIKKIIKDSKELTIFSDVMYWQWNENQSRSLFHYIRKWLNERKISELKLLGYEYKITSYNRSGYIENLPLIFYEKWINSDPENVKNKLAEFTVEKLTKWTIHLCKHYNIDEQKMNQEINTLCFPKYKFYINVILESTQSSLILKKIQDQNKDQECPICFQDFNKKKIVTGCNHEFCISCITHYMRNESIEKIELNCPLCRTKIEKLTTQKNEVSQLLIERYCIKPKSKINTLFSLLIQQQKNRLHEFIQQNRESIQQIFK